MQRQRSKTKPCRDIAKGEPVLVRDYRDNNKWKQRVIVHKLGPVTYQVQVGDLVWKRHIDQIREFVPQENKDIPNILENTKSDIDTEYIIVPTCNSKRDAENSENNNESERTKITENKTVENANDTIITRLVIDLVDLEGQVKNLSGRSKEYANELVNGRETYILIRVERCHDGKFLYTSLLNNLEEYNSDLMVKLNSMSRPQTRTKKNAKKTPSKSSKNRNESPMKRPGSGEKKKR
ncbi:unnamed protein product [Mytilus coruscus]|uniref:Uncharacterized protein n=1 Tax=Mytilus coruscus TaxID=42192 RepID=A0A6J8BKB2_MYTCO|nr:unnamed protein product [Mytilus coruscus]